MFKFCLGLISVASTSKSCLAFHTSAVLHISKAKEKALNVRKTNIERQAEKQRLTASRRPSVVLGTRPDEEHEKWSNCDLAKVIVDEAELAASHEPVPSTQPIGTVHLPRHFSYGVDKAEQTMLFRHLPYLSAQAGTISKSSTVFREATFGASYATEEEHEQQKANVFAKVIDLRNADAGGIAFENRRRIILAFSTPENPFDSGRPEVQAALMTYQIRNLWAHLSKFKRDVGNRLGLRKLVHKRAKILKYLKSKDRSRYEAILERLALERDAVEGELVV